MKKRWLTAWPDPVGALVETGFHWQQAQRRLLARLRAEYGIEKPSDKRKENAES